MCDMHCGAVRLAAIQRIHNISSTFGVVVGGGWGIEVGVAQVQQPSLLLLDGYCTFQASYTVPDFLLFDAAALTSERPRGT